MSAVYGLASDLWIGYHIGRSLSMKNLKNQNENPSTACAVPLPLSGEASSRRVQVDSKKTPGGVFSLISISIRKALPQKAERSL